MKKTLLTIATLAIASIPAMANEHTLVFDGENDMAGLKRQTTTKVDEMEFVKQISLSEEGIDFSLTSREGDGNGFALVNAGGENAGIYVSSKIAPKITLTVPNGNISDVKICLSGYGVYSLDLNFNGKEIEYTDQKDKCYYWEWSNESGTSELTIEWAALEFNYARYVHSIAVTYTPDLGGKHECGLSFNNKNAEAFLGEDFTAPKLNNPNELPITWASTNGEVATVDESGSVTIAGTGITTIIAATEGNEQFAAGNAKYELTVLPVARDIAELKTLAPAFGDLIKVDFPATVTFASGIVAFVMDAEGNAGIFENIKDIGSTDTNVKTIYKVGEVIPEGWVATNYEKAEFVWAGIPPTVTETVDVTYPEVESITPEDADRVVILKNVTFDGTTAEGFGTVIGTTPDGEEYKFQNDYNVITKPAGTYDVTCVVRYSIFGSTVYFWLAPIAYADPSAEPGSVAGIESADKSAGYYDLQGRRISNPTKGIYIKVAGGKATKIIKN